ncbi:PRD domain-containing protein [Lacticaseibacillus paracasei]|uniref:PRD domain-containing protein n=1 Tax=Lacticaseibacillus paracasei TaxID=1597 RepID=UPI003313ECCD
MRAIKKMNNNIAVCLDGDNHELIAIGKGIGFPEMPYEITDLGAIQRTFYNVDSMYVDLATTIPEKILDTSAQIVDLVRSQVDMPVSSNLVFTLADHINLAIERKQKGIIFDAPMKYDIQHLYADEYELGVKAVKIINNHLQVRLPEEEATNIALHLINAKALTAKQMKAQDNDDLIPRITEIISGYFDLYINKHSFNYSRFVTHLQYLLKRQDTGKPIRSSNVKMYHKMVAQFPEVSACVDQIADFLQEEVHMQLSEEEKLYLILHVNRLCTREDL